MRRVILAVGLVVWAGVALGGQPRDRGSDSERPGGRRSDTETPRSGRPDAETPRSRRVDPDTLRTQFLAQVTATDMALSEAQAAVTRAAASSRQNFDRAARMLRLGKGERRNQDTATSMIAQGVTDLLNGLSGAEDALTKADQALKAADDARSSWDMALSQRYQELSGKVADADREIEGLRQQVKSQWDNYRSPRIAGQAETLNNARVALDQSMTRATAASRDRDAKKAEADFIKDFRGRLAQAGRSVSQRQADVQDLRDRIGQVRDAVINPLDVRRPAASLDKSQDWPATLKSTLDRLDEEFQAPKPNTLPSEWKLEDRVKRFLIGGGL